jgi:hypothetical protein
MNVASKSDSGERCGFRCCCLDVIAIAVFDPAGSLRPNPNGAFPPRFHEQVDCESGEMWSDT